MATWPPTADEVIAWLAIPAADPASLGMALAAAVAAVQLARPDLFPAGVDPTTVDPGDDVHLGAVMQAGKWYTRRVNTTGVDPVTGLGVAPTTGLDLDVALMIGVRYWRRPAVG